MAGLIMPVAVVPDAVAAAEKKGRSGSSADFVTHVRRVLAAGDHSNKFGVAAKAERTNPAEELEKIAEISDPAEAMAAFLALLKEMAVADTSAPGGGWQASASTELLDKLAASAGLDADAKISLLALFDGHGEASMSRVLDIFARHFTDIAGGHQISLPETDLPLLNTMLDRLGLGPDDISALEKAGLGSNGRINLEAFVAALKEVAAAQGNKTGKAEFSFWEIRDLRDLMARAGWKTADQDQVGIPLTGEDAVSVKLSDLVDLLQKTLNMAVAGDKGPDLPAFVDSLKTLLSDSGFSVPADTFSAVAVKSRDEALTQLLQTVDLSTVKIKKMASPRVVAPGNEAVAVAEEAMAAENAASTAGSGGIGARVVAAPVIINVPHRSGLDDFGRGHESQGGLNIQPQVVPGNITAVDAATPPRPPLPIDPQLVLNQLTSGVAKGIAAGRHHIRLLLQPPELGEIKIDLVVRHDQVAVSFALENSRIKDILDANMQQFRDQLSGRGFNLAGLDVSVGNGEDNPAEKWREVLGSSGSHSGRALAVAGLSEVMAPYLPARMAPGDVGINIMV